MTLKMNKISNESRIESRYLSFVIFDKVKGKYTQFSVSNDWEYWTSEIVMNMQ